MLTWKCRHTARLPLEWRLQRLVRLVGRCQVVDPDVAVSSAHDQQRMLDIHGVHTLGQLRSQHGVGGTPIPVFESLIPTACRTRAGSVTVATSESCMPDKYAVLPV